MKKRIGYMIAALIVALFVGLLLWRFVPRSCAHMMSVDESAFTNFSSHAMIHRFDLGSTYTDMYYIEHIPRQEAAYGELMEILTSSRYRPDFRNLLPWDLSSLSSGNFRDLIGYFNNGLRDPPWPISCFIIHVDRIVETVDVHIIPLL